MGRSLKGVSRVRWAELTDATGSATDLPGLLGRIAWGNADVAQDAVDQLGDRVCELGFVVQEATPHVVPFLLELVADPAVTCRAELLALLTRVYEANQWESAAAAAPSHAANYEAKVDWEQRSRTAVAAGAEVFAQLVLSAEPEVARLAGELLGRVRRT
ncbi:hypothetical protein GL263_12830 [Streptomyces durbertensis]|uniref:HEAT repeat domain-containing protein n=1 Tax=Streptomyces durbertensis TaxID=2448886 RepID=A0ABR6EIV1_9ACTN|nr:hypothetical protein [Streptomyces durbertensis]MBB1244439.1 hypothetical protein [Streptomyces durbertensis]